MMKRTIFGAVMLASFANHGHAQTSGAPEALGENRGVVRSNGELDLSRFTDPVPWASSNGLQFLGQYSAGEKFEVPRDEPGSVFSFTDPELGKTIAYIQSPGITGQLPFVVNQNISNSDELVSALSIVSHDATPALIHALRSRFNHTPLAASDNNFRINPGSRPKPGTQEFGKYLRELLNDDPSTQHLFPSGTDIFNTGGPVYPDPPREPGNGGVPIPSLTEVQFNRPEASMAVSFLDPATEGEPNEASDVVVLSCTEAEGSSNIADGFIPCGHSAVIVEIQDDYRKNAHCSGVVVSPRHVLTAAHCIFPKDGPVIDLFHVFDPTVRTRSPDTLEPLGQVLLVSRYRFSENHNLQHENRFNPDFFKTPDLSLFEFHNRDVIHNVRVPWIFAGDDITGREMQAIGYGKNPNDSITGRRQIVRLGAIEEHCPKLWVLSDSPCNSDFEFIHSSVEGLHRTDVQLAGLSDFTIEPFEVTLDDGLFPDNTLLPDSCVGDSGGPIFVRDDRNAWSVAAITSRPLIPRGEIGVAEPRCTGLGSINVRLGAPEIMAWLTDIMVKSGCVAEVDGELVKFSSCVKS